MDPDDIPPPLECCVCGHQITGMQRLTDQHHTYPGRGKLAGLDVHADCCPCHDPRNETGDRRDITPKEAA